MNPFALLFATNDQSKSRDAFSITATERLLPVSDFHVTSSSASRRKMLMRSAPLWIPRIAAVIFVLLGLATLHYFYGPHLDFGIKTEDIKVGLDTISTGTHSGANDFAKPGNTEQWPIKWIPEKHWQIWRVNVADLEQTEMERMRTWRLLNPFHRYEIFSHESAETFVRDSFMEKRPEIVNTFFALRDMIIRADFFRYLVLYSGGGVYSDIDTKALKPIDRWIPDQHKNRVNAVIGLEIDDPDVMWADWADNFVFCQSTLMVSPGHRIYEILIGNILNKLEEERKKQGKDLASLDLSFQDVLKITGPVAFTTAVLGYFTETMGEPISRANFSGINVPKKMADVLVMPTVSFVPGQQHSRSGKIEDKEALVQHMGMGSWRDSHKLESEKAKEKEEGKLREGEEKAQKEEAAKEQERIKQEAKKELERIKQEAHQAQDNNPNDMGSTSTMIVDTSQAPDKVIIYDHSPPPKSPPGEVPQHLHGGGTLLAIPSMKKPIENVEAEGAGSTLPSKKA